MFRRVEAELERKVPSRMEERVDGNLESVKKTGNLRRKAPRLGEAGGGGVLHGPTSGGNIQGGVVRRETHQGQFFREEVFSY